jgi:ABC-type dipeptide/oligopeptide/nickel transport system permease component
MLPITWSLDRIAPEYYYLILPVVILAARPMAQITRLTRAMMIDTMQQEFIRTAVAKGVPRGRLIFRHALRNSILPVITSIGTSFGFLLTGSFVIERYFVMPGLGSATIEAIQRGDMPVIQAGILVTGSMFIFLNLLVDILLPILDPRIRESQI